MPRNMGFKIIGNLVIAVYNEKPPTDEDHKLTLAAYLKLDPTRTKALVVTGGGAPTTLQRKDFTEAFQGHDFQSAVVTDSAMARAIVTAISWFNKKMKAFPRAKMEDAFKFLEIPPGMYDRVHKEIQTIEAGLRQTKS